MLRLKSLRARAFRGLVDGPELRFGSAGLLICGDNGSGKSSFVEAIEKALTGKCGSLDRGVAGLSSETQGQNVGCEGPPEIELVLTDGNRDERLTLGTDRSQLPGSVQSFLEAACHQSFVLRRRTLLDFVDARPHDRYEVVERFLNLRKFMALEEDLRGMLRACQAKLEESKGEKGEAEGSIRRRLGIDPEGWLDEEACQGKVNEALDSLGMNTIESPVDARNRLEQLRVKSGRLSDSLGSFLALVTRVEELPSGSAVLKAAQTYGELRREAVEEEAKLRGHFYGEVLTTGLQWITEDSLHFCPLCNSLIDIAEVTKWVCGRLAEHEGLTRLRQKQAEAWEAFKETLAKHRDALAALRGEWGESVGKEFPSVGQEALTGLRELATVHDALLSPDRVRSDAQVIASLHLDAVSSTLRDLAQEGAQGYPDSQQYKQLYQTEERLLTYCDDWPRVVAAEARIQRLTVASSQLQRIVELAEAGRKGAVQKLLDKVANVAAGYIEVIHPNEQIGVPELPVREAVRASLGLQCRFYEQQGDPRGYYSEGHLDSLGLCLFLAMRRLHRTQRPDFSLLVLDDVLHSVDGKHRRATANLILDQFSDHQIMITTHDPLWFEYLMGASRASSTGRGFESHRITQWSLEDGPKWGDHLSDYDWLRSSMGQKARPCDRVLKAGRLLEAILQNLCHSLQVTVPLRMRGDYTIDPLWTNFHKRAKNNHEFRDKGREHLEAIDQLRRVRNWVGAHWNEWAGQLTAAEARDFSDAVVGLRDCAYCDKCRQFVTRIRDLDGVWSCKKQHLVYRKRIPTGETT